MAKLRPSRTLSVAIDRPPAEVYAFAANPEKLPRWSFITSVALEDGVWRAQTPAGTVGIRFVDPNPLGVLDHFVTVGPDNVVYSPMRVISNGAGSEVLFTLYRLDSMSDEDFERDAQTIAGDLAKLKEVLEASA
ncbi:SRPBCC family protein [Vulgatibacter incomptus]|uniref:Polyketide cyclase/dehydrase n=1 Tax=Vulgatibacter incomptus TaxID=1391653 RepID=A0A0K1PHK2_9BACT|nr:SRPBCC family protein [Vulgatibacter incomptus]AKU92594.1 hypothetical protein AKJ08_2981 [Vulgatibacter incomptus]